MSARREKRLRKLEATVSYMDARVRVLERKMLLMEDEVQHSDWALPQRSLWRRLLDTFKGRDEP